MKATKLLVAGVAIMSAGFGLSGSADAARSTAEVTITPGNLLLEAVPDLQFETVGVEDIAAAEVTTELESGTLSVADASSEGLTTLTTTVGDYRGTGSTGWSLSAEFAPFTKVGESDTILATMNMTPTAVGFTGTIAQDIVIGSSSTLIASAVAGQGLGVNNFVFSPGTTNTLTIPQQPNVQEGVYQAAMTWTLTDTP